MRVLLEPAFILHQRAYRESSLLLNVFTPNGRMDLIARGVRKARAPLRPLLQPFVPLLISFQGKAELMTLTAAEAKGKPLQLLGDCLLSGFYLNELIMRMLPKQDPYPRLYTIYEETLLELERSTVLQEKTLRLFEKNLLHELGYGLQLQVDFSSKKEIVAESYYQLYPEQGFKECGSQEERRFSGKSLLSLAKEQLDDKESLQDAKRIMRLALSYLLGPQPLQSRKLFM